MRAVLTLSGVALSCCLCAASAALPGLPGLPGLARAAAARIEAAPRIEAARPAPGAACAETGTVPAETLPVNLEPLIDTASRQRIQFAVDIPHPVSPGTHGRWLQSDGQLCWTYRLRIPGAVSLSLHAPRVRLPPSARVSVAAGEVAVFYTGHDPGRDGLWTRPLLGDELSVSIALAAHELPQLQLQIDSWQAGYRALGGAAPDHPYYQRLHAQSSAGASCVENYACLGTPANSGPANATMAIVVSNLYQCTGTLLNNTRNDRTPYVLTARHCQTGRLGAGDPGAAARVTLYWDAVSACGATLGSIYDGSALTQSGATTLVEQQDAWLLRLDAPPVASDAFYAGWDATGGTFVGGYSIHHALGNDKQYIGWYGQPLLQRVSGLQLKVGYASTFWGLVNGVGSSGGGASGAALFDPDNRVVGSASLAVLQDGEGSAGICPMQPAPAPAPNTVTAQYTSLAAIWSAQADTTSSTGPATLQSVLDPDGSGQLVLNAWGEPPVATSIADGQAVGSSAATATQSGGGGGVDDAALVLLGLLALIRAGRRARLQTLRIRANSH